MPKKGKKFCDRYGKKFNKILNNNQKNINKKIIKIIEKYFCNIK